MGQSSFLWTIIELAADLFETLLLISLLSHLLGRRFTNPWINVGTVLGLVGAIYAMNTLAFPDLATVGIYLVLSLIVATTLYRGSLLNSFLLLLVYNILWGASEMGVLFILSMIFGSPDNFALPTMQRLVGLISTKLVLFILVRLLIRFRQPKARRLNWSYYLALLAFPSATVLTIV